jgi:hypothetical protein
MDLVSGWFHTTGSFIVGRLYPNGSTRTRALKKFSRKKHHADVERLLAERIWCSTKNVSQGGTEWIETMQRIHLARLLLTREFLQLYEVSEGNHPSFPWDVLWN